MNGTTFFVAIKKNNCWEIKFEGKREKPTDETFSSYESAVEWINKNYSENWIDCEIDRYQGHLMTFEEWAEDVKSGSFIDYDGYGDLLDKDYSFLNKTYYPSKYKGRTPKNAKYILWYNK